MSSTSGFPILPRLLVVTALKTVPPVELGHEVGLLVREAALEDVVVIEARASWLQLVIDLDSVEGLGTDASAVDFLVGRIGVRALMTRRPLLAARAAEQGCLALLRVFALDSTGLERARAGHPRLPGVGTAISPGLVIPHLTPADLAGLQGPVVSDGLVRSKADALASFAAGADSVVVPAGSLAAALEALPSATQNRF